METYTHDGVRWPCRGTIADAGKRRADANRGASERPPSAPAGQPQYRLWPMLLGRARIADIVRAPEAVSLNELPHPTEVESGRVIVGGRIGLSSSTLSESCTPAIAAHAPPSERNFGWGWCGSMGFGWRSRELAPDR
jgi:hypothetical protein